MFHFMQTRSPGYHFFYYLSVISMIADLVFKEEKKKTNHSSQEKYLYITEESKSK